MLLELNIENFAIIKDLKVEFTKGLNIITGETGTGKSILIEALSIVLGARTNKDLIRTGEKQAFLEAVFFVEKKASIDNILDKYNIKISEDRLLIITRQIHLDRPSISKINGRNVNLSMLGDVTSRLVDIFGQFEHQSLLNIANHKELIDSFGDENFKDLIKEIDQIYFELCGFKSKLGSLDIDSSKRDREVDILKFQIDEIEHANLRPEEDENLDSEFRRLQNLNKILSVFSNFHNYMNSEEYGAINILNILSDIESDLLSVKSLDEEISLIYNRVSSMNIELMDLNRELKSYTNSLDIDEKKIYEVEGRLDTVNKLKNKYGESIYEIFEFKKKAEERLCLLENQEEEIGKIEIKIRELEEQLEIKSLELSKKRKDISQVLESGIKRELADLNMEDIDFKIRFTRKDYYSEDGIDKIEFLISTNIGEGLKPLSKIASGGEMSRIMLAFKSILASYDSIQTLIFDEIDTGISGRTAQIVGEKIYDISKGHQVICISHLPQITALADSHYVIMKETKDMKTGSSIKKLSEDDRVLEMARLIGGADLTDTTLQHALEMIEMSKRLK